MVIQKGGVKIAVLGVFGKDALECAPTCELEFKDPVESAKNTVEEIKKKEDVDMIACVSHSGTWEDEKVSEDAGNYYVWSTCGVKYICIGSKRGKQRS